MLVVDIGDRGRSKNSRHPNARRKQQGLAMAEGIEKSTRAFADTILLGRMPGPRKSFRKRRPYDVCCREFRFVCRDRYKSSGDKTQCSFVFCQPRRRSISRSTYDRNLHFLRVGRICQQAQRLIVAAMGIDRSGHHDGQLFGIRLCRFRYRINAARDHKNGLLCCVLLQDILLHFFQQYHEAPYGSS
jgi:hypothetical protein